MDRSVFSKFRAVLGGAAVLLMCMHLAGCASTPKASDTSELGQIEQRRNEARAAFAAGEQARNSGNMQVAMVEYRRATMLDPTLAEAWNNLGVGLLEEGTFLEAADAFRRAMLTAAPEDPRPARNLGYTYAQAGWAEESLRHYETALERSPNDLESLRGAIRVTRELNHADSNALGRVQRAMLLDRDDRWREIYKREESRIKERLDADRRRGANTGR